MITMDLYAYLGGAWTSIKSDITASGVFASCGIFGNKETDRIARDGSLSFELMNNTGKYTPGSVTAHADWKKGTPVKVEFTKGGITKVKFIGRVNTISLSYNYNNKRVRVTALDWIYFASQLPLDIPALQTSQRADEIINIILGLAPISPTAESIATGTDTFTYAFHDNTVKTTAYTELTKAALSEWGYLYSKLDGTFVFESYNGRASTQKQVTTIDTGNNYLLLEDGSFLLQEDGSKILLESYDIVDAEASTLDGINIKYGENIVNRMEVTVYPYKPGFSDVLVYTNEEDRLIPNGETISFRVQFTNKESRQPIAAIAPSVKQYTLLHMEDNTADGITGVLDDADLNIQKLSTDGLYYPTTPFSKSGGNYTSGKFNSGYSANGTTDYIFGNSQDKMNFGSGDFTVDWWEYRNSATAGAAMVSRDITGVYSPYVLGYSNGTTAQAYITSTGSSWDIANGQSMGTISTGTWVHYAITRSGNTFRTFKNGTQQATWTSSATILSSSLTFSLFRYNGAYLNGIIDEFRMIKGYAAWTADFSPPSKPYSMSGLNWNIYTGAKKTGTEITASTTATTSFGGAGMDFTITNSSGSDGYLNLDIYAQPLESLSPISYIKEDTTSINTYGYFSDRVEMRLRDEISKAQTIADAIVTAQKDPLAVLDSVSMVSGKTSMNDSLFMYCDIGDLVRVNDSLSGYNALNYIQGISWDAVPVNDGALVRYSWSVKEQ